MDIPSTLAAIEDKAEEIKTLLKGTKGPHNARVMIIGEAYGANEETAGQPFVGASGEELNKMLIEAGLNPADIFYTNVINKRPMGNQFEKFLVPNAFARDKANPYRGIYPTPELKQSLAILEQQIALVNPAIIIAVGNWPLWFLYDGYPNVSTKLGYKIAAGIDSKRGSMYLTRPIGSKTYPFIPTYHPAGVLRQWSWRHTVVHDFRRVTDFLSGKLPWYDTRAFNWKIQPTANEVEAWVNKFLLQPGKLLPLTLDLETYKQQIHIIGVRDTTGCLCVAFMDVKKTGTNPAYSKADFIRIANAFRRLLSDPRVRLVGQNLTYDLQYLDRCLHVRPKILFDTMIAQHILFVDDRKGLDYLASLFCRFYQYWKSERKESIASESTQDACEYNCKDLEYTYEVWRVQERLLVKENLVTQFNDRIELVHILIKMMRRGVRIDPRAQASMGQDIMMTSSEVISWLERSMPQKLKEGFKPKTAPWYNSNKKLVTILYERLNLRAVINKTSGGFTVDKEAMATLIKRYPHYKPLFNMIAALRSLGVFYNTFVTAKLDTDGRIRCEYKPAGPITNRLASAQNVFDSGLNLQNIPREREEITMYNAVEKLA